MSLEIVIGPMFSGKSTYALSYIRKQRAINKNIIVIKPNIDTRYSQDSVMITHNNERCPCILWDVENQLGPIEQILNADCVVFEEAQFFKGLSKFIGWFIRAHKKNILIVGLDADWKQRPFGEIIDCIPWASSVIKLHALCCECKDGTIAPYTRRIHTGNSEQVDVGGAEKYQAVCLTHLIAIQ